MMRLNAALLLAQRWQYVVLDEGHKIRNPDAEVTLICKRFNTGHRVILTGAPIQNKLTELWSLFDFVYPGRLGTLPTFEEQFALPIASGAYANASAFRVQSAYQCSVVLRDLIRPYLLRRTKADVQLGLPDRSEQVLFCQLSDEQRSAYEHFLRSDLVGRVLAGRANAFSALTALLKVCNHPHLLTWEEGSEEAKDVQYGDWQLSGKMCVLRQVLRMWHASGDRALVFCQTRQMLDIVQGFVSSRYRFCRLDGTTPVGSRLRLIDEYNGEDGIFVFLLTTRAGGLGVNLTGANRVLLMDPDWNPANDVQARERAYRIGQQRAVTVYRLVTAGTLEEKVYQRQIFKQVLSNNVLKDPKQTRRVFKPTDLRDLLARPTAAAIDGTETADMFAGAEHLPESRGRASPHLSLGNSRETVGRAAPESASAAAGGSTDDTSRRRSPSSARPRSADHSVVSASGSTSMATASAQSTSTAQSSSAETGFLSQLLRGELVASALDHDAVVGDAAKTAKNSTAALEAKRVAERAATLLRDSFEQRRRDGVSVPTWTGRSGGAGLPANRRFGLSLNPTVAGGSRAANGSGNAPSAGNSSFFAQGQRAQGPLGSTSLLQRIRERQDAAGEAGPEAEASRLLRQLCEFMARQGGRCTSQQLVEQFKTEGLDARLFKQLLKEAARRESDGSWVLKEAWRSSDS
jgi:DNA excision repair protein ERCC-6